MSLQIFSEKEGNAITGVTLLKALFRERTRHNYFVQTRSPQRVITNDVHL